MNALTQHIQIILYILIGRLRASFHGHCDQSKNNRPSPVLRVPKTVFCQDASRPATLEWERASLPERGPSIPVTAWRPVLNTMGVRVWPLTQQRSITAPWPLVHRLWRFSARVPCPHLWPVVRKEFWSCFVSYRLRKSLHILDNQSFQFDNKLNQWITHLIISGKLKSIHGKRRFFLYPGKDCWIMGKDVYGGDFRSIHNVGSLSECRDHCRGEPECMTATISTVSDLCMLKNLIALNSNGKRESVNKYCGKGRFVRVTVRPVVRL